MQNLIPIQKLSVQLGLTSRTLRHWEAEGLFQSQRGEDSGWRLYDETAVLCIRITALLRRLDIPIEEIRTVLEERTPARLEEAVRARLGQVRAQTVQQQKKAAQLSGFLQFLQGNGPHALTAADLQPLLAGLDALEENTEILEELIMENQQDFENALRIITLPPMRAAYHTAVGLSPEDAAIGPITAWIKEAGLLGTARLFGGNVDPMPAGEGNPYGYGMCVSIPEGIPIPPPFGEMRLPGGLYAMLESTDDIGASWQRLMDLLNKDKTYMPDPKRLCFEEHIRNDAPEGCGNLYSLNLHEAVKRRK